MKLPIISGKKVIKLLTKKGFIISRRSGSHVILTKMIEDRKQIVVVPLHKELATGTLRSIITQSKLAKEEFFV